MVGNPDLAPEFGQKPGEVRSIALEIVGGNVDPAGVGTEVAIPINGLVELDLGRVVGIAGPARHETGIRHGPKGAAIDQPPARFRQRIDEHGPGGQ